MVKEQFLLHRLHCTCWHRDKVLQHSNTMPLSFESLNYYWLSWTKPSSMMRCTQSRWCHQCKMKTTASSNCFILESGTTNTRSPKSSNCHGPQNCRRISIEPHWCIFSGQVQALSIRQACLSLLPKNTSFLNCLENPHSWGQIFLRWMSWIWLSEFWYSVGQFRNFWI